MPEAAPYGFSLDQIMQALTAEGERQRRQRIGDPSSVAAMLLEQKANRAGQMPQVGGAPFGMPSLPEMPANRRFAGPTPEQRALVAPLVTPRGSSEPEVGLPGIVAHPLEAWNRGLAKAGAGARPAELAPEMTDVALGMGGASSLTARPAGSLGIFLGRRQAEHLAGQGRPAALEALKTAETMEQRGASPGEIRRAAHAIFRRDEPNFGTIWKPHPKEEWRFEIADKKSSLPKSGPELGTVGGQFKHPDLYAAEPGTADVELRRVPGQFALPGTHALAYHQRGNHQTGLASEIGIAQGAVAPRDNLIAELQHEMQWQNDWARGGSSAEFKPGGPLAHKLLPGEPPSGGYGRLLGEIESKVARARSEMDPQKLRSEPVEETIRRMQEEHGTLPRGPVIRERYTGGGRFRSSEEDEFADMARKGFAREQAISNQNQQKARGLTGAVREQLGREDALGSKAEKMGQEAAGLVRDMRAAGKAPKAVAAELEKRYGTKVDPQQVATGNGWWNASTSRRWWTPEEQKLLADLHRQGTPLQGIADKIREFSGREITSDTVNALRRQRGLPAREGETRTLGGTFPREANLAIAQMVEKGMLARDIAKELTKRFGYDYTPSRVNNQINGLRLGWKEPSKPATGAWRQSWQPDALAILRDPEKIKGMTAQEIADLIQHETGQVVTRASVLGRQLRLREEKMRAELAEDLAKAKD